MHDRWVIIRVWVPWSTVGEIGTVPRHAVLYWAGFEKPNGGSGADCNGPLMCVCCCRYHRTNSVSGKVEPDFMCSLRHMPRHLNDEFKRRTLFSGCHEHYDIGYLRCRRGVSATSGCPLHFPGALGGPKGSVFREE